MMGSINEIKQELRSSLLRMIYQSLRFMDDETYLKLLYLVKMKKRLHLDNPVTFNEKLQWLKLHDRKPEYTTMVDKYEAKKYVADIIGEEHIIPTLGVWDSFDDIDFASLPEQFVLKCTHDSGGLVICRDRKNFDIKKARKKFNRCLNQNYFWKGREWPYKNVKPRIIAEQYMEEEASGELKDYKIYCFDGVAKTLLIVSDRQKSGTETKDDFFDVDFRHLPFTRGRPNADICPSKPETFEEMKEIAEKLSKEIPHLRVDFYEVNEKAYFGELTFSPCSGVQSFDPEEWDCTLGSWIKLPEIYGGGYALISEGCVLWLHESYEQKPKQKELTDYKFYCFDGKPEFIYVSEGMECHETASISFLTLDWQFMPFRRLDYEPFKRLPKKPDNFAQMLKMAERLSRDIPFVRVDLYEINGKVYFSELTFRPGSGLVPLEPSDWDKRIGEWLTLPMQ